MFSLSQSIAQAVADTVQGGSFMDTDVTGAGIAAATNDATDEPQVFGENILHNWRNNTDWAPAANWLNGVVNSVQKAAENIGATAAEVVKDLNIEIPELKSFIPKSSEDLSSLHAFYAPWEDVKNQHREICKEFREYIPDEQICIIIKGLYCSISSEAELFIQKPDPNFSLSTRNRDMACSLLKIDKNLETLRFKMVPRIVSEIDFWSVYLDRVEEFERFEFSKLLVERLQAVPRPSQHVIQTSSEIGVHSAVVPNAGSSAVSDEAEPYALNIPEGAECNEAGDFNDEEELAQYEKYLLENDS